jgi:hypothetical protein
MFGTANLHLLDVLLKVFIGFLSLTALLAIVSVLNGKSGETQIKVLATTFSICAGSICAMLCAGFLERKGAKGIGYTGLIAAAIAVLLAIGGVWAQIPGLAQRIITAYWKTTATVGVVAVALAYGCLLRLPNLTACVRWTQTVSTIHTRRMGCGNQTMTDFIHDDFLLKTATAR